MTLRRSYLLISLAVVLSGASGLTYEVIWFRRFSHVWGSSAFAMAAVVASFLGGLGLGARVVGPIADRVRRPLYWYGVAEILIGICALLIPTAIGALVEAVGWIQSVLKGAPAANVAVRLLVTSMVIGVPCFLMGGTLPLIVRQVVVGRGGGAATAWLYGMNTLGGAAGCLIAGFVLLPTLGLAGANSVAAVTSVSIGIVAVVLGRTPAGQAVPEPAVGTIVGPPRVRVHGVAQVGAAIAGFAALILQVAWVRQLTLVLGGTTYAFSAMLFTVLLGLAVGSLVFRLWLVERSSQERVFSVTLFVMVLSTVAGQRLLPELSQAVGALRPLRGLGLNAVICVAASMSVQMIPAAAMGVLFPWFVHYARGRSEIGDTIGKICFYNTVGAMVGAIGAALVVIPAVGIERSVMLALGCYVIVAGVVAFAATRASRHELGLASACSVLILVTWTSTADPRVTNYGMYLYGFAEEEKAVGGYRTLYYREGMNCTVIVRESSETGGRSLSVNGKVDASDRGDMRTQLGLAYLPHLLHPEAKEVCVIGLGSGCTAGASLLFGARVTCCEIEPAVVEAARFFGHVNHRPEESPNFRLITDDGRAHLQMSATRYDLVLSEPSNPWLAGIANLFTREFYELVKSRLRPDGVLAQWIQIYSTTETEYASILRTVLEVFPNVALFRTSEGDTVLLASARSLRPWRHIVRRAAERVAATPTIRGDLRRHWDTEDLPSLFIRSFLLDTTGVRRFVERAPGCDVVTDHNLRPEFEAPISLFRRENVAPILLRKLVEVSEPGDTLQAIRCGPEQMGALVQLHELYIGYGNPSASEQVARIALEAGEHPYFVAAGALTNPPTDSEELARLAKTMGLSGTRLGVALYQSREFRKAAVVFAQVVATYPDSATSWANLGINYLAAGDHSLGRQALRRAYALDPFNDFVRQAASRNGVLPAGETSGR